MKKGPDIPHTPPIYPLKEDFHTANQVTQPIYFGNYPTLLQRKMVNTNRSHPMQFIFDQFSQGVCTRTAEITTNGPLAWLYILG